MKIRNRDVDDILATVRQQLQDDKTLSVSLRATIELLIALIQVLAGRLGTDSANSSKPPCASNDHLTWLAPHEKRGQQAMDEVGILPRFQGVLCHDHWK
ncbi:MAG: hypothetical protein SWN10_24130, partial [Pseudomonadota bacterium]|nr:hypothetical protein [Pseudomonadota bacterium]